jgi:hypothetical protein
VVSVISSDQKHFVFTNVKNTSRFGSTYCISKQNTEVLIVIVIPKFAVGGIVRFLEIRRV